MTTNMNRVFAILCVTIAMGAGLVSAASADDGVLMFGATGKSGSEIALRLIARGEKVTAFVRPSSNRARLAGAPISYVEGDATNAADVAAAFAGKRYRVVIETLQGIAQPTLYSSTHANIAAWTKKTGVKQVVMMSSTGADHQPADFPEINWQVFGDLLKDQTEAERILRDSGVGYTIIRVGAIISQRGKPPHPPTGKSYLTEDLSKYAAVAYDDLIEQTAACVDAERCLNKIFVIADDTLAGELPHFICRRFAKDPDKECG